MAPRAIASANFATRPRSSVPLRPRGLGLLLERRAVNGSESRVGLGPSCRESGDDLEGAPGGIGRIALWTPLLRHEHRLRCGPDDRVLGVRAVGALHSDGVRERLTQ